MNILEKILSAVGVLEVVEGEEEASQPEEMKKPGLKSREGWEKAKPVSPVSPAATGEPSPRRTPAPAAIPQPRTGNVVALPVNKQQVKVMLVKPKDFDDVQAIADHIKAGKPVVVNFEDADESVKKRITDFISGTIYALNGHIKMVGNKTMVGAPTNVDIEEIMSGNDFGSWRQ